MAELSGSLAVTGIAPLLEFLSALGKTGEVVVSRSNWIGQLSLDRGRLTAGKVEHEQGLAALEFIALYMQAGEFEFFDGPPSLTPNLDASTEPLAQLKRMTASSPSPRLSLLPAPSSIPRVVVSDPLADGDVVVLPRSAIYVLVQLDGCQTVRDIAAPRGLLSTVQELGRLSEFGLITYDLAEQPVIPPTRSTTSDGNGWMPIPPALRAGRWRHATREVLGWVFRSAFAQAILVTGLVVLGVHSVVQNFRVDGVSMQPSFEAGQVLVVNRAAYFHIDGAPLADVLPTTRQGKTAYLFGGPQRGTRPYFGRRS